MSKKIRVGRANDNDIVLIHESVSRYHIEVFIDDDKNVFVTDLGSSNGSFVNGNKIRGSVLLKKGDILKLGANRPLQWQKWIGDNHNDAPSEQNNSGEVNRSSGSNNRSKNKKPGLFIILILLFVSTLSYFFYYNSGSKKSTNDNTSQTTGNGTDSNAQGQSYPVDTNKDDPSKKNSTEIQYDYSCASDDKDLGETEIINTGKDITDEIINHQGADVTLEDEVKLGDMLHDDVKAKYNIIKNGEAVNSINQILNRLLSNLTNPRGFAYKIYLIQSEELNAFTAGARIYMTTEMYDFCENDDERACVIGHEIYHNELGHLKKSLKLQSLPGGFLADMLMTPFKQKQELECDLHGIDLAILSQYQGCASIYVWRRMSEKFNEGEYNAVDNIFRTHPYSTKRENCSRNHMATNYNNTCNN